MQEEDEGREYHGEDEDGHGRQNGWEERDTSSTLGQAQSIEVCFGRTKLTLCRPASPDPPLPSTRLPTLPIPSSTHRTDGACYLNEGLPTLVGG